MIDWPLLVEVVMRWEGGGKGGELVVVVVVVGLMVRTGGTEGGLGRNVREVCGPSKLFRNSKERIVNL